MIKNTADELKAMCKTEQEGEYAISQMDIFKTCFWNEPIPMRKLDFIVDLKLQQRQKLKLNPKMKAESRNINILTKSQAYPLNLRNYYSQQA